MIELLAKYGFRFRGTCDCAGPKTHKYKIGDFTVYWNKRSKKFRLKQHGKYITTLTDELQFESKIKEFLKPVQKEEVYTAATR